MTPLDGSAPTVALHERIRRDIEARIMSGEWRPGYRIPYEHELTERYGCARMTVNRALSALAQSGLIDRRKRAGSFVATPRYQRAALEIPDIRAEVTGQGRRYGIELRSRKIRAAGKADKALLCVDNGRVLALDCRHLADGRPYAVERRLINLDAVPEAASVDFAVEPPGSWLLGHVAWTEAEHRITAIRADTVMAKTLAIEAGEACLSLERWTWRSTERITYARQIYPGGAYGLIAHFKAG